MQFFDRPPFFFLSVSSHHKTAVWWDPDIGGRRTVELHAFDLPMITIKTFFSTRRKTSKTNLRVCVTHRHCTLPLMPSLVPSSAWRRVLITLWEPLRIVWCNSRSIISGGYFLNTSAMGNVIYSWFIPSHLCLFIGRLLMVSMETELAKYGYDAFGLSGISPSLTLEAVFLDIERWWCICTNILHPPKEKRCRADTSFSHSLSSALHPHLCQI